MSNHELYVFFVPKTPFFTVDYLGIVVQDLGDPGNKLMVNQREIVLELFMVHHWSVFYHSSGNISYTLYVTCHVTYT